MRRAPHLFLAALVAGLAGACSNGPALSVVLRTDFAPTTEFTSAQVVVDGMTRVHDVAAADDFFHGVELASYGVSVGSHDVRVSILDAAGRVVAHRRVILTLTASYTLVVELTRGCASLACPGTGDPSNATECLGTRCVDPHCGGTDSAACPPSECALDSDCPAPVSTCAGATCDHGICLYEPHPERCSAPTPICDLALGCVASVTPTDAGPPPDLGAMDGGTTDAAPSDAGPADLGVDANTCFSPVMCLDTDPCTRDQCVGGFCDHPAGPNGTACDAGLICGLMGGPTCMGGVCTAPFGGTPCPDDGNPCTQERCGFGGTGLCRHVGQTGTPCTDLAGCPSTCNAGTCTRVIPAC